MSIRAFARLGLPSLVLASFGAAEARAAEQTFDAYYSTREGVSTLSVLVDAAAPEGGETRIVADGEGLLVFAGGDGTSFDLVLAANDGSGALTFEPAGECAPSREGDGCSFDLALTDARGSATGITARVMVSSGAGSIDPALATEVVEVATRGFGSGLSTGITVDARPSLVDLEIYVELRYDGDLIDFTDFDDIDLGDVDPPDPDYDSPTADPPDPDLEVYRVLTYNVAALPQTAFSNDDFNPDDDYVERGHEISDFILDNDYDIVVLNEVFVDEMRETLIGDLEAEYPYIIREAWDGGSDTSHRQDSGLMMFSRFPGDPIDIGTTCNESSNIDVQGLDDGGGTSVCDAAFWPFTDLDGEDTFSEKGFFWAHLYNPRTGRPISILGTHAQATYYAVDTELFNDEREARASNFKEILAVIDQVSQYGDDLILMGDMNVIGDYQGNNSEYLEIFGPSGWIRDHDLGDMWRDTTSPDDPGFSWDGSDGPTGNMVANNDPFAQERLDYMVAIEPGAYDAKVPAPCFQHMQLRRDAKGLYGDLSDHYGVEAVIGWDSDRCSPMQALTNPSGDVTGEIAYSGAYQWYRFDEPGTYTLQVYSPDLDIDVTVYDATDLSTPLSYFEGEGEFVEDDREITSVLDVDGPFYLRVKASNPLDTGNYTLSLNQNAGTSWTDYLVLEPFEEVTGTFGQVIYGSPQDHLYFKFAQKALWTDNLGNQEHTFVSNSCVSGGGCTDATISLWDEAHNLIYTGLPSATWLVEAGDTWFPNVNDQFYVTIDRSNDNTQREVMVVWTTDLKTVTLGDLTCHIQEDWYGDDDVYADIEIDGVSPAAGTFDLWYGQMDTNGNVLYPVAFAPIDVSEISFKGEITIDLYEVDDIDADDWLGEDTIFAASPGFSPYTTSDIPDPDVDEDPDAMVFYEDDAAYSLNWWVKPE